MLFDTHAHLDDPQLLPRLDELLENAADTGLVGIAAIGTDLPSSQNCVDLAREHPAVHAAVGIHPNVSHQATDSDWDQIVHLATQPEVVAIGETGLDRYWDDCPIDIQRTWFARHIELSFERRKPLVIHMRECEADILDMLQQHQRDGQILGIMHSFAGSWETAKQCLDWGMAISFAGMVTFKNAGDLRAIAARIPDDRLLIETDSPYLTPHPHRGQRPNQPSMVQHTAACLAEVRGVTVEQLAEQTTRNARRFFNLD